MDENTLRFEELAAQAAQLSPLDKVRLIERIMPVLEQELAAPMTPEDALSAWSEVYDGLSEKEIREIEHMALDRSHFMKQDA